MQQNGRIAFNACFTAFGVAITVARLTIRYYVNRNAHKSKSYILGDVFVVLALLFAVSYAAADMWLNKMAEPTLESAGLRYPELMEEFISAKLKTNFFLYVVSVFALYTVKASFLCFYSDLTKGFKTTVIPVLYGVIGITVAVVVVNIGWIFGSCVPISRFWSFGPDNCLTNRINESTAVAATSHLVTDFAMIGLGYMIVRESSRISGGLRWAVAFIFGLSLITIVITIARLVATLQLWSGTHKGDFLTSDAGLRLEEWLVLSCLAELHVGLLAIFLPSLRMWWRRTHAERKRTQQARECEDGFPALPAMRGGIPGLSITDEIRTVEIRSLNNCGKTEVETRMIRADFRGTNNEKSVE